MMTPATTQIIQPQCPALHKQSSDSYQSAESSRCKSTGWTPLVYPASALLIKQDTSDGSRVSSSTNPYFPLHPDVLRAAARELLTIDGSIDGKSLKLNLKPSKFQEISTVSKAPRRLTGPLYLRHVIPQRFNFCPEEAFHGSTSKKKKKRKLQNGSTDPRRKIKDESFPAAADLCKTYKSLASDLEMWATEAVIDVEVQNSEALVDIVIGRALFDNHVSQPKAITGFSFGGDRKETAMHWDRRLALPRKVSDVDGLGRDCLSYISSFGGNLNSSEISCFLELDGPRKDDGSLRLKQDIANRFLDVSIVSESLLKDSSLQMTSKMLKSIDEKTLRHFLGYKSSSLKNERLRHLFSEYLFDVSHAMFAWEQTEHEILSERRMCYSSNEVEAWRLEITVRDALFDERALRKIGGFDDSSLLRHALSIRRLRSTGTSWEDFAKSANGKRLLRHHHDDVDLLSVGQKRRGQRVRSRPPFVLSDSSDEGRCSRASSIASADEALGIHTEDKGIEKLHCLDHLPLSSEMPCIKHLTLTRLPSESWGVLLAKEGDLCVVVRAPISREGNGLQTGDIILSTTDECGETTDPGVATKLESDWFRVIVKRFKTSVVLHLTVQRVKSNVT